MNSTFDSIVEKLASDKILLVCGPQVSASSLGGLDWKKLVRELIRAFDTSNEYLEDPIIFKQAQRFIYPEPLIISRGRNPEKSSDELEKERQRRRTLTRYVAHYLDDPTTAPSHIHKQLAVLPFNNIVTTNWDNMLETALEQQGKQYLKVVRDADMTCDRSGMTVLIKLYGSVEQSESLKITLNDIQRVPTEMPEVMKFLEHASATRALLFIGFDSADYEFTQLYNTILNSTALHKPRVFVVNREGFKDPSYWMRRDVEFIENDMEEFLKKLCNSLHLSPSALANEQFASFKTSAIDAATINPTNAPDDMGQEGAYDKVKFIESILDGPGTNRHFRDNLILMRGEPLHLRQSLRGSYKGSSRTRSSYFSSNWGAGQQGSE